MFIDYQNLFSNRQAVATGPSENVIDVNRKYEDRQRDIGPGYPIEVLCVIADTVTGATALSVDLQTSDTEDFADAVTLQTAYLNGDDQLIGGAQVPLSTLPAGCRRYLRLNYTLTGTPTAGTITAGLILDRQINQ